MSKAKLEFNLDEPHDRMEFVRCSKATEAYCALWRMGQDVFRPARKHGYSDPELSALIESCGDAGVDLVGKLEQAFYSILEDYSINIDEELE